MTEPRKARIATVSLAGCFGFHMAILDIDERLIELMKQVEFDRSPLTDLKVFTRRCDVGIVEGGCCNEARGGSGNLDRGDEWMIRALSA